MLDGETKPPPLLTEADLIALMEKHGIGKIKSCISAIVQKVIRSIFQNIQNNYRMRVLLKKAKITATVAVLTSDSPLECRH